MPTHNNMRSTAHRSPTPVAGPSTHHNPPQNSRDKKRHLLSSKIREIVDSFTENNYDHFTAQLCAIQCDLNLVMRADPYRNGPLNDSPAEIGRLTAEARDEVCKSRSFESAAAEESFNSLSSRLYTKFVDEVNGAMEERDKELTMLFVSTSISTERIERVIVEGHSLMTIQNNHQHALSDLRRQSQFKVQMAHEEHTLLIKTIRDRLIQQVTQKRSKLLKDKEQLDIADSNALLLNPTQFSIGNPTASPGGAQNRKTRNTRYRPGEVGAAGEDSASVNVATENKRKRKAALEDNDNGSPAPTNRTSGEANGGGAAPYRDVRQKLSHQQFDAPLYSIERLFSDRELLLNMQRAHNATNEHFEKLRTQGIETRLHAATAQAAGQAVNGKGKPNGSANGATRSSSGIDGNKDTATQDAEESEQAAGSEKKARPSPSPPPSSFHATRSTGRAANVNPSHNPLNDLADTAAATNALPTSASHNALPGNSIVASSFNPYAISLQAATAVKANSQAPPPPSASDSEIQADLAVMKRGQKDLGYDELVKTCLEKPGYGIAVGEASYSTSAVRPTLPLGAHDREAGERDGTTMGGVAMGRQSSAMGAFGGAGMERQNSGLGSIMMSKSNSLQGVPGHGG